MSQFCACVLYGSQPMSQFFTCGTKMVNNNNTNTKNKHIASPDIMLLPSLVISCHSQKIVWITYLTRDIHDDKEKTLEEEQLMIKNPLQWHVLTEELNHNTTVNRNAIHIWIKVAIYWNFWCYANFYLSLGQAQMLHSDNFPPFTTANIENIGL